MDNINHNLSETEIKDILENFGYKLSDKGRYWQTNALYRNGDNPTALQIFKDSGVWRDFVEGTAPLPFVKLIELQIGTKDPNLIKKYVSNSSNQPLSKSATQEDRIVMEKIFKDSVLDDYFPHYDFYNKKGIDSEHLKLLKGGLCTGGKMYQRFVFPVYNEFGQIHGLTGRDMTNKKDVKWKHEGRKTQWIYPYFMPDLEGISLKDSIDNSSSVILVESIGDLLSLYQHGFKNCLVTFGLDISPKLLARLSCFNNKVITIGFNNDYNKSINRGARAAVKNYLKLLNHFDFNQIKICLPVKNDFGEMNSDDFSVWQSKCKDDFQNKCKSILTFAKKMASEKDLPLTLVKNIKILESNV
tara:strand:+ start:3525 stop:4595 length:1071 start_codon:yes stop_codon:yes gene_type:complete